ncbi:hypothetical protein Tco_0609644, partial [Tanacetum coccineum]
MPSEDEVFPDEEQPLPAAVSPTACCCLTLRRILPTIRDDGDDEDESSDDDEDGDADIEGDKEEEEHPAPADSTAV